MSEIFINYRREQSGDVGRIYDRLCLEFGAGRVFLDKPGIKAGERFPEVIERRLSSAEILLAVIGPKWTSLRDRGSSVRRLDMENDWVRIEIERALDDRKVVIPVLVDRAKWPTETQVPPSIRGMLDQQFVEIHPDFFTEDLNDKLIAGIKEKVDERKIQALLGDQSDPHPAAAAFRPVEIKGWQLRKMKAALPRWNVVRSRDRSRPGASKTRVEIERHFKFPSFLDAVRFMRVASKRIDPYDHHPRWENLYQTVTVRLSTWDSGYKLSDRDYKTALMFEKLYRDFLHELFAQDGRRRKRGG